MNAHLHTKKSFRNLIKSNWNQIVVTIFRLICNQTDVHMVPNQPENGNYNLISVWFDSIRFRKKFSVCRISAQLRCTAVREAGDYLYLRAHNWDPLTTPRTSQQYMVPRRLRGHPFFAERRGPLWPPMGKDKFFWPIYTQILFWFLLN